MWGGEGGAEWGGGRPAALSVGQLVSLCTALSFLPWRLLLGMAEVAVAQEELDLSDFVMEEDAEMCAEAGIPVSGPSTLPNSVDIQQRIESALSSFPGLQASNVTVKVCVITNNHGTVNF